MDMGVPWSGTYSVCTFGMSSWTLAKDCGELVSMRHVLRRLRVEIDSIFSYLLFSCLGGLSQEHAGTSWSHFVHFGAARDFDWAMCYVSHLGECHESIEL